MVDGNRKRSNLCTKCCELWHLFWSVDDSIENPPAVPSTVASEINWDPNFSWICTENPISDKSYAKRLVIVTAVICKRKSTYKTLNHEFTPYTNSFKNLQVSINWDMNSSSSLFSHDLCSYFISSYLRLLCKLISVFFHVFLKERWLSVDESLESQAARIKFGDPTIYHS